VKRLAAPSTPDYALENTGVSEVNVGAALRVRRGATETTLSYRRYQADLGVCSCLRLESADDFHAQLESRRPKGSELYRAEFEIERPSQAVVHDMALLRTRWDLPELGSLSATYSFQHDHRLEYEVVRQAVTGPQFDFRLLTHELEVALDHRPIHLTDHLHLRGAAGASAIAQRHYYSGLPLIPDYSSWGAAVYASERLVGHDFEVEAGLRYDAMIRAAHFERRDYQRLVRSGQLAAEACAGAAEDRTTCRSAFQTLSASLGGLRQLGRAWAVKAELSTASRPPNPDEQYLNGSAPTFPVVGLGKPDLRPETTYAASSTVTFQHPRLAVEASAYANLIRNYIYFAPAFDETGAPIFDVLVRGTYPRFITKAVDALFFGVDGGVTATPLPALELNLQGSMVRARNRSDDSYLVFVPADQLRGAISYRCPNEARWGMRNTFASLSGTYVARQRRYYLAADFAAPPAAYFLLGAELGAERRLGRNTVKVALTGSNLLNTRYRDYTSLLRYFADQPGWQAMLRVSLFSSSHS
jgi:iron complex outermembrane recepter protein